MRTYKQLNPMISSKPQYTKKYILILFLFISIAITLIAMIYYKDKPVYAKLYTSIPEEELTEFSEDFTSPLPIIEIETDGDLTNYAIPATGTMRVFNNINDINALTDMPSLKILNINLHIRGNSSFGFNKKGYHLELYDLFEKKLNYPLLNFPAESEWVLHGPYADKSLIRNYIAYNWGLQIMDDYSSHAEFFELWQRGTGKELTSATYMGVYVLLEKIKVSANRVNIGNFTMTKEASEWFEQSGGYMIRRDHMDVREQGLVFTTDRGDLITIYHPDGELLTEEVFDYITEEYQLFEDIIYGNEYLSEEKDGVAKYIDIDSFIDTLALNELMRSVDGGRLSAYYYRDVGGKLKCGPIWDFDLAAGNADYNENEDYKGFCVLYTLTYDELSKRKAFIDLFKERWIELRKTVLSDDNIEAVIDDAAEQLEPVQERNFDRWPELFDGNTYIWPNPAPYTTSWEREISLLKNYLLKRAGWLDNNIDSLYDRANNFNE